MSVCKDYTAEQERVELLELARRYHALRGLGTSEEDLEETCRIWFDNARRDNVRDLDLVKQIVADVEFDAQVDAKATTCMERREMLAEYLGIPPEEYGSHLGSMELHEEELHWLQARTNERNEALEAQLKQFYEYLERLFYAREAIESGKDAPGEWGDLVSQLDLQLDILGDSLEKAVIVEKQRLERKLQRMTLKARRPAVFRLKVYRPSFRRARTRAPRSARRASFSMAASSPGGGGDSSGESDQGDPPGPHPFRTFVTPSSNCNPNQRPLRPWLGLGCCRMERGRSAW